MNQNNNNSNAAKKVYDDIPSIDMETNGEKDELFNYILNHASTSSKVVRDINNIIENSSQSKKAKKIQEDDVDSEELLNKIQNDLS